MTGPEMYPVLIVPDVLGSANAILPTSVGDGYSDRCR